MGETESTTSPALPRRPNLASASWTILASVTALTPTRLAVLPGELFVRVTEARLGRNPVVRSDALESHVGARKHGARFHLPAHRRLAGPSRVHHSDTVAGRSGALDLTSILRSEPGTVGRAGVHSGAAGHARLAAVLRHRIQDPG